MLNSGLSGALLDQACRLDAASERLFEQIDSTGRPVLRAMLRVYGGLLGRIERVDYDVFTRRVRLPAWRKALIGTAAIFGRS